LDDIANLRLDLGTASERLEQVPSEHVGQDMRIVHTEIAHPTGQPLSHLLVVSVASGAAPAAPQIVEHWTSPARSAIFNSH